MAVASASFHIPDTATACETGGARSGLPARTFAPSSGLDPADPAMAATASPALTTRAFDRIKSRSQVQAYFSPRVARHIGHGRNTPGPAAPPRSKSRPAKTLRDLTKRLHYAGLRDQPY